MFRFGKHTAARHIDDWAKRIEKLAAEFQRAPESMNVAGHAEEMLMDYEAFIIWLRDWMMHHSDFEEFARMRPLIETLGRQVQNLVVEVENRHRKFARELGLEETVIVPMHNWEQTQMIPRLPARQREHEDNDVTSRLELKKRYAEYA